MAAADPIIMSRPWHCLIDTSLLRPEEPYQLLPAGKIDFQRVCQWYQQSPVQGWGIKDVKFIYNRTLTKKFEERLALLEARYGNPDYDSKWSTKAGSKEEEQRQFVKSILNDMVKPHQDPIVPHVNLIPMWKGTQPETIEKIFKFGFADLSLCNEDYWKVQIGRGLYSVGGAKLADKSSKGPLLINWLAFFSAFPAIESDEEGLRDQGHFQNYDAHFALLNKGRHEMATDKEFHHTQLVVFDRAQGLPRFYVELQPELPSAPLLYPFQASKKRVEEERKESDNSSIHYKRLSPQHEDLFEQRIPSPAQINAAHLFRGEVMMNLDKALGNIAGRHFVEIGGPRGIGKSTCAQDFAFNCRDRFSFTWTIKAQSPESIRDSYLSLAQFLGISVDSEDTKAVISSVNSYLETRADPKPYLLIVDNYKYFKSMEYLKSPITPLILPSGGRGVILCTQNCEFFNKKIIQIKPYNKQEIEILFKHIFQKAPDKYVMKIAKALHFFPEAIGKAFLYMKHSPKITTEKFLTIITEEKKKSNLDPDSVHTSIIAAWTLTCKKIKEEHPEVFQWLKICNFLKENFVPPEWIEFYLEDKEINSFTREIRANQHIRLLISYDMLPQEWAQEEFVVSLFKDYPFETQDPKYKKEMEPVVLSLLEKVAKELDIKNKSDWRTLSFLKPHVLFLKNKAPHLRLFDLLEKFARWEMKRERWQEALTLLEHLYKEKKDKKDELNIDTLSSEIYRCLGEARLKSKKWKDAIDAFDKALNSYQEIHQNNPANDVVRLIMTTLQGKYDAIEGLGDVERTRTGALENIKVFERLLSHYTTQPPSANDLSIPCILFNLGHTWIALGDCEKANDYYRQSKEALNDCIIRNPMDKADLLFDIATNMDFCDLKNKKDFFDNLRLAINYFEEALKIYQQITPKNSKIGEALTSLAYIHHHLGDELKIVKNYYDQSQAFWKKEDQLPPPIYQVRLREIQEAYKIGSSE